MRRLLLLAGVVLAAGCVPPKKVDRPPYYGPTEDLSSVIGHLNERSSRLVSMRAEGSFSADIVDPKTQKHDGGDGDLTLLYTPARNLRMVGKVFGQRIFDIGSNDERYWLVLPRQDQMFWGTHDAQQNGRAATLPIRPDVIGEVLGVSPIDEHLLAVPAPVLRFNHDADCYMVTWQVRLADRWAIEKEVWYDRQSLQPTRVLLYDPDGRVVLRADPSDPQPVTGYSPELRMPSRYDLRFTDSGSTFTLRLKQLDREQNGAPNERSFLFPAKPGVSKVESLDR